MVNTSALQNKSSGVIWWFHFNFAVQCLVLSACQLLCGLLVAELAGTLFSLCLHLMHTDIIHWLVLHMLHSCGCLLGECTRIIASEHTLIIFSHRSTSHANRVQFEATQYQCGLPLTSLSICRGRCISWCVVLSSQLRLTSLQSVCSTRTYATPSPNLLTLCK